MSVRGFDWGLARPELARALAEIGSARGASPWREARARLCHNRAAWFSLWFLVAVGLGSLLVPLLPLPSPIAMALSGEPRAPIPPWQDLGGAGYEPPSELSLSAPDRALAALRVALFGRWQTGPWLGTDSKGRDLLARIAWGSRTSILAALCATLCSLLIGVGYGAAAGWLGGRADNLMMRAVDALYSIPFIFFVIFLITLLGGYQVELEQRFGLDRERLFYLVIGAVYWLTMARVVRGQVLALKQADYVHAARLLGASGTRILVRHLLPNALPVVIVCLTLTVPSVMLFEAFLSFLGLGVEPPNVSWGILAADGAEAISPLRLDWWLVLGPAAAMGSVLLALCVLGDGLRDALDPKSRGGSAA